MKKIILSFIPVAMLLIFSPSSYSQVADSWKWLNPQPQGNSLFAIDFADNFTGYSVGAFGTILKTTDNGDSWNQLNAGTNNRFLSVNFITSDLGYIGGFNQMLLRTTNGGVNWNAVPLPREGPYDSLFSVMDINFINTNTCYVLGFFQLESKIWKTTDGGTSFTTQTTAGANYLNTLYFLDENTGYATGGALGSEIIRTTNGGTNWELVESYNYPALTALLFMDAVTGFAAGENGCVLMTTNSGTNWTQVGSPSSLDISSIIFIDANTGFGLGSGSVYVKTTNGGLNWTEEFFGLGNSRMYMDAEITDEGTIHSVGTYGVIIRSTNSGNNWTSQYSVTEKTLSEIEFVDNSTGYAVCGYSGGDILKTTDAGETWVSQAGGAFTLPKYGLSFTDNETGYIAGSIEVRKTTNGGQNWTPVYTSTTNEIFADVVFTNSNTGYVVGTYGRLLKTTNAGVNWVSSTISSGGSMITGIDFVNENIGYGVGDNGVIIKTTNAGLNWVQQTSPLTFSYLTSVSFTDENTGYISSGGGLLRTTNGGINWSLMNAPSGGYYKIQFRNTFGYAVASNGKIVKSIDAGVTWIEQPTVTDNGLYALYFNTDNNVYAGGTLGSILSTIPTELRPLNTTLNLTMFIEGFYNANSNSMVSDNVKIYLRNSSPPYSLVDSATGVLSSQGNVVVNLTNVTAGQYYIVVKHRNSIETWSKSGGEFITPGTNTNYDMSDQKSKAFGNNLKQVDSAPIRFASYSGDVNQDGRVNLTDIISVNNNAVNFLTGSLVTDLTGDNITNLTDVLIANNNSVMFVTKKTP